MLARLEHPPKFSKEFNGEGHNVNMFLINGGLNEMINKVVSSFLHVKL